MDNIYSDALKYQEVLKSVNARGFETVADLIDAYDRLMAEQNAKTAKSALPPDTRPDPLPGDWYNYE